jgi:TPR repeat protein
MSSVSSLVKQFCDQHKLRYVCIPDAKEEEHIGLLLTQSIMFEPQSQFEMFYTGVYHQFKTKYMKSAVSWYEKAAKLGNSNAMINLADYHYDVTKDMKTAVSWYEQAAKLGNAAAINNLAHYHQFETKDMKTALSLYEQAAQLGNTSAMYNLGFYHKHVTKDSKLAEMWYEKSAEAGDEDAMEWLGNNFEEQNDFLKAFIWYKKANAQTRLQKLVQKPEMMAVIFQIYDENMRLTEENIHLRASPDPGPDFLATQTRFNGLKKNS